MKPRAIKKPNKKEEVEANKQNNIQLAQADMEIKKMLKESKNATK